MAATLRLRYAGFTHIGMKRSQNQDHFVCAPELSVFVVCDGMGGHKGGETASLLAVTTICDSIRAAKNAGGTIAPNAVLRNAILDANRAVNERAKVQPELQGMGTTCTTLFFHGGTAYIGHVGDSRAYLLHPKRIWQLTRDHSLVQEKLRAGLITRDQLKTDKMKNVITRSVGFEGQVDVDIYQMAVHAGDSFLLCSDGLSGLCDDSELTEVMDSNRASKKTLEDTAKALCEAANRNGGDDNVTSVLVSIS